jgi:hypothetical protein
VLPGFPLGTPPSPPRFAWRWPRILLKSGLPLKVGCPPFPFRHLSNLGPPPVKKNRALLVTTSTSARQFLSQFPFSCFFPLKRNGTTSLFFLLPPFVSLLIINKSKTEPIHLFSSLYHDPVRRHHKQETAAIHTESLPSARVTLLNPASSTVQFSPPALFCQDIQFRLPFIIILPALCDTPDQ